MTIRNFNFPSIALCLLNLEPSAISFAEPLPHRISSTIVDTGQVKSIHMVVGLGTVISFPASVTDAFVGDPLSVKFQPLGNSKNQIRISLNNASARSTNLFVWTGEKQFVFDIVVSKNIHQDSLKISASYDGTAFEPGDVELEISSHPKKAEKSIK